MHQLFTAADPDGAGVVPYEKFKAIVFDESLGISPRLSQMIILEQEINDDGTVSYQRFLEISTPALDQADTAPPNPHTEEQPRVHIHGLLREEFEALLAQKLQECQASGTGEIERPSIKNALQDQELGLSQKEVNLIMGHIETTYPDGTFDYTEIAAVLFELLFTAHEDNILGLCLDPEIVLNTLLATFEEADQEHRLVIHRPLCSPDSLSCPAA
jgi:Ca2+-binding EF-hand superfamily protein